MTRAPTCARADEAMATLSPTHPQRITRSIIEGRIALADRGSFGRASRVRAGDLRRRRSRHRPIIARLASDRGRARSRRVQTAALDLASTARAQARTLQGGKPRSFRTAIAGGRVRACIGSGGADRGCTARGGRCIGATRPSTVDASHPDVADGHATGARNPRSRPQLTSCDSQPLQWMLWRSRPVRWCWPL